MRARAVTVALLLCVPTAIIFARSPNDPDFRVTEIRDGVYTIRGGGPNVLVLDSEIGLTVVDTKPAPHGDALHATIRKFSDRPIAYVVLTHAHDENVGGVAALRSATTRVIAHDASDAKLRQAAGLSTDLALHSRLTIRVGDELVTCHHKGAGHTAGDLVVHLRDARVLAVGGLVADRMHPAFVTTDGADLRGWIRVLDQLARDFGDADLIVVPGDGEPGGTELLTRQAEYLRSVLEFMENAQQRGWSKAEAMREAAGLREKFAGYAGEHLETLLERAYEVAGR